MMARARIATIFFFVLLAAPGVFAGEELPSHFLTADSFARQFRSFLTNKIAQMDQNYIRVTRGSEVHYYDTKNTTCQNGVEVAARQKLFKLYYNQKLENKEYSENRFYYGCDNKIAFRESYRVKGLEKNIHSQQDIFAGEMKLQFEEEIESLFYELSDEEGNPVFEISLNRSEKADNMVLKMGGEKVALRQIKSDDQGQRVRYFSYPYSFSMSKNGSKISMSSDGLFKNHLSALITEDNILYFNEKRERISMASFQNNFQFGHLNHIMDSLLAELPRTKFVTSNTQGGKMLEELRNAQTFLISGTQLNLVRNMVEEYIKAVQEGAIVDRRK